MPNIPLEPPATTRARATQMKAAVPETQQTTRSITQSPELMEMQTYLEAIQEALNQKSVTKVKEMAEPKLAKAKEVLEKLSNMASDH
jgi:hypothetical protein